MAELEQANNPDAERTLRQRYQQTIGRLQAELRDQVLTKMENLDEDHETLEYARQRNELLSVETKAVLTAAVHVAGDYDCILSGVYGEVDLTSAASNQVRFYG